MQEYQEGEEMLIRTGKGIYKNGNFSQVMQIAQEELKATVELSSSTAVMVHFENAHLKFNSNFFNMQIKNGRQILKMF